MQIALVTEEVEIESSQRLPSAVLRYIPLEYPPDSLLPWHVAFSSDGHSLAVDNVIYDTDTWTERFTLTGHTGAVTSVAFSPNGDIIATSSGSTQGWFSNEAPDIPDDTIHLWDAHTGEQLAVLQGHTEGIWQVVFSPDGALLASGSGATINDVSLDGTVRLWGIPSQAIEPNY
jgi:WD40 repeat protein